MIKPKKKPCDGPCSELKVIWKNHEGKRYCKQCWSCHEGNVKHKPTVKQSPIPRRSEKRSKEERLYTAKRLLFLAEKPMCEACISGVCTRRATEVHHKKGRIGELLLNILFWLAVCHECHEYIENNRTFAIEQGFSIKRID